MRGDLSPRQSKAGSVTTQRGMARADADLVAWLVEQHLVMSSTAQKQDLGDPDVIAAFASFQDEDTIRVPSEAIVVTASR